MAQDHNQSFYKKDGTLINDLWNKKEAGLVACMEAGEENFDPEEHWVGLPEADDVTIFKELTVRFSNEKDVSEFASKLGIVIDDKTQSIWWQNENKGHILSSALEFST